MGFLLWGSSFGPSSIVSSSWFDGNENENESKVSHEGGEK